ncbi:MAG TPA: phosphate propanoyltransferase [Patescibacteria group bacterium]|nr:phosphate propanoyltransferase [Patescibacteria group bacterium]
MDEKLIEAITAQVIKAMQGDKEPGVGGIPIGVSNRHIHIAAEHLEILFGKGHSLTKIKDLAQIGEYAAAETVTLVGPKGVLPGVRVLGPVRSKTQIELSRTDGFILGIKPPVRDSGDTKGTPGVVVVGTAGAVTLTEGVICSARHLHMNPAEAAARGLQDGQRVAVESDGCRGVVFKEVLVRVKPDFVLELHLDTDEANAAGLKNGDLVTLAAPARG